MRTILLLVKQEIRIIFSDKKALVLLFLMPALLILFLSLALTDIYKQKVGKQLEVAFLVDGSKQSNRIVKQFSDLGYSVVEVSQHSGIQKYITNHKNEVVIEVPEDFSEMIQSEDSGKKISFFFDPSLDKAYSELVKSHVMISMQAMIIDEVNEALKLMEKETKRPQPKINKISSSKSIIKDVGRGEKIPNPIQQTVPAWALFAMFFIALPMAGSFIRDRETGILKRLLCYNLKKRTLLLGKLIPYLLINNLQFYLMFFLGLYVVPSFTDSSFKIGDIGLNLVIVSFICSLAATSYGLLVSSLAKSNEQAASFGAISVVIMALFGGVMIPHFAMPSFMQKLSVFSPLYWGLESYLDLFLRNSSLIDVAPRLYILLLFSLVAFLISLKKFRWSD